MAFETRGGDGTERNKSRSDNINTLASQPSNFNMIVNPYLKKNPQVPSHEDIGNGGAQSGTKAPSCGNKKTNHHKNPYNGNGAFGKESMTNRPKTNQRPLPTSTMSISPMSNPYTRTVSPTPKKKHPSNITGNTRNNSPLASSSDTDSKANISNLKNLPTNDNISLRNDGHQANAAIKSVGAFPLKKTALPSKNSSTKNVSHQLRPISQQNLPPKTAASTAATFTQPIQESTLKSTRNKTPTNTKNLSGLSKLSSKTESNPTKPTKTRQQSFKSQLKSQIQQLQRQRKQRLQLIQKQKMDQIKQQQKIQKEEEKRKEMERIAMEKKKANERRQKEREEKREEEERAREEKRRRKEEERKRREEERRIKEEEKRIAREAAQKLREEARLAREVALTNKQSRDQVKHVMNDVLSAVAHRVWIEQKTGVEYEVCEAVSFLVKEVEKKSLENVSAGFVNGGNSDSSDGNLKIASIQPSIATSSTVSMYQPYISTIASHPALPYYYNAPYEYYKANQVAAPSTLLNSSKLTKQPKPVKPPILHSNPINDLHSPFSNSHQLIDTEICIVKKAIDDSFGVILRWECKSTLVPNESEADTKEKSGTKELVPDKVLSSVGTNNVNDGMDTGETVQIQVSESINNDVDTTIVDQGVFAMKKIGETAPNVHHKNSEQEREVATSPITNSTKVENANSSSVVTSSPSSDKNNVNFAQVMPRQRRKRRKRVNFGVMTVVETKNTMFAIKCEGIEVMEIARNPENSKKNNENDASDISPLTLQPGDIILSINGNNVGGLTFAQACQAITSTVTSAKVSLKTADRSEQENLPHPDGESLICCVFQVARRIPSRSVLDSKTSCTDTTTDRASVANFNASKSEEDHGSFIVKAEPTFSSMSVSASLPKLTSLEKAASPALLTMTSERSDAAEETKMEIETTRTIYEQVPDIMQTTSHTPANALAIPSQLIAPEPKISFDTIENQILAGEFSFDEWRALVCGVNMLSHQLYSGMAILPTTLREIFSSILTNKEYGKILKRRNLEALEAKWRYESAKLDSEMTRRSEQYWISKWNLEVEKDSENECNSLFGIFLTDAKRSILRSSARPAVGCKCGSRDHEFVDHPDCILYRDVKLYHGIANNSSSSWQALSGSISNVSSSKNSKSRNALEAAYVERFLKLRAETEATRKEAEFVLEMEKKQSAEMKMAVFAPSICTMLLSAVAFISALVSEEDGPEDFSAYNTMFEDIVGEEKWNGNDDEDDDVCLTSLKRKTTPLTLATSKRRKMYSHTNDSTRVPSSYFLAEILNHISLTYGHLFREPTHVDYAWQQRHRSAITRPLSKDTMFQGNPRTPGSYSFENVRHVLDQKLIARLKNAWQNPHKADAAINSKSANEELYDEWIVSYLCCEKITGLYHEINTMKHMKLISISQSGRIVLSPGWEARVPQMVLEEMKDAWGSGVDVHNLYCVNETVRKSLERNWERVGEVGWRLVTDFEATVDDEEDVLFEDDEYQLRKQIFEENYDSFLNEESGVGDFGI